MALLVVLLVLVALALLGPFLGADSRDGLDWRPFAQMWATRGRAVRPGGSSAATP